MNKSTLYFPTSDNLDMWKRLQNSGDMTYNIAGQEFFVMAVKYSIGRYGEDLGMEVTLIPSFK